MKRCDIIKKDPAEVKIAVLLIFFGNPHMGKPQYSLFYFLPALYWPGTQHKYDFIDFPYSLYSLWQVIIVYGYIIMKVIFATYIVLCQILTLAE